MKIIELCEAERPREKMLSKGAEALGTSELLAIIIRNGTRTESALELAQRLLSSAKGSLTALSGMSPAALSRFKGIGSCKAAQIAAALELGRRFMHEKPEGPRRQLCSARSVYDEMIPFLKGLDHEETWIILVNSQNITIDIKRINTGGQDSTIIDIRQILAETLEQKASGVFLVHNHPSGSPVPSSADMIETEKLQNGLTAIGIRLVDHVIITDNSFYSFADECESCI